MEYKRENVEEIGLVYTNLNMSLSSDGIVRTLLALNTWECPASLDVFEEVIVVGYCGCWRRLCPVGIDLAIPVAIQINELKFFLISHFGRDKH